MRAPILPPAVSTHDPRRAVHRFAPRGAVHRFLVAPFLELLHFGATPRRLAWSVAIGVVVGLNPLLGSTTILALAAAGLFRLNFVASQLAAHLAYPFEIALFFVFIRLGDRLFHTGRMPIHGDVLLRAVRHHPWETTRLLWTWEWHALVVWGAAALVLTPCVALALTSLFERLHRNAPVPAGLPESPC